MKCCQFVVAAGCHLYYNNRKFMNLLFLFFLFTLNMATAEVLVPKETQQQGTVISGTVSDKSGPLPGVSITIKGTTQGGVTDINGKFYISVPDQKSVLVFSFVGYITQEITVTNQKTINLILVEDTRELEEVVVAGYGIQKKESSVAAIGQVKGNEMLKMSPVSLSNALTGTVAGVPFYPAEVLEQYPDLAHPDPNEAGWRLGDTMIHTNASSPYTSTNFSGQRQIKSTDINTTIKLQQKLDFITPGLLLLLYI